MRAPRGAATWLRLDELDGLGYTTTQIAEAARLAAGTIDRLYDDPASGCQAEYLAVLDAYRQLAPDLDEMVIERFIAGDPPDDYRPTIPERREIVRLMILDRVAHREIADRVRANPRTVLRIAADLGLTEHEQVAT